MAQPLVPRGDPGPWSSPREMGVPGLGTHRAGHTPVVPPPSWEALGARGQLGVTTEASLVIFSKPFQERSKQSMPMPP